MKAKFGLNLDFSWIILFSIENQWFFLLWILKNRLQPGFLENQEAALCFIYNPGLVNQYPVNLPTDQLADANSPTYKIK